MVSGECLLVNNYLRFGCLTRDPFNYHYDYRFFYQIITIQTVTMLMSVSIIGNKSTGVNPHNENSQTLNG